MTDKTRQEKIDHLTKAILDAFETASLPKEERMDILSEAFMQSFQITKLGTTLLSEEELIAPPKIPYNKRDKSRKQTLEEHLKEQFADRIGRGFARKHLQKADKAAYTALAYQISHRRIKEPSWLAPSAQQEHQIPPLTAIRDYLRHR